MPGVGARRAGLSCDVAAEMRDIAAAGGQTAGGIVNYFTLPA
jgi:hypothetical protein